MNILISAVAIRKEGGSSRHLRNFISAISSFDKKNKYFLCINKGFYLNTNESNIKILTFDIKSCLYRVYWDQIKIRKLIKKYKINVVISLLNFGCINSPVKQINFQRGPTCFCKYYLKNLSLKGRIITFIRRNILYLTMKSSEVIITPTRAMRDMIRSFYPNIKKSRFAVIHHIFDKEKFLNTKKLSKNIQDKLQNIPSDTIKILYVSHLMSYKGYDVLINASKKLKDSGIIFKLIITMERKDLPCEFDKYTSMIKQFSLDDYIMVLNRVPEDSVADLYKQCDVFVFPSLCESFGFPMVEAMGLGLPVVAAGTNVNREVCGEAALYYDPLDYNEAAKKIILLIKNKGVRNNIIGKAIIRFRECQTDKNLYASKIITLIEKRGK